MGEELCTGCRDCANNNPENDFLRQANPPPAYLNNPFFAFSVWHFSLMVAI